MVIKTKDVGSSLDPQAPPQNVLEVCDVCGNRYDKPFRVIRGKESFTFDSLECAVHKLAPVCRHCQCRVLGHGVEAHGAIFCCAHCARQAGEADVQDRAPSRKSA